MAVQLIHKNSSVEDRRPTAAQLANGELSVNFNEAGPFLCCKDTAGNIQQLGGIKFNADVPADAVIGTWWYNTATDTLYVWNGSIWHQISNTGGGGGSGITQILGDDGIDALVNGSVVTLNVDLAPSKGLHFEADRLAINPGANLSFDAQGKLRADIAGVSFKGTIDLASDPVVTTPSLNDVYINTVVGTLSSAWQTATGEGAIVLKSGDQVVYGPSGWSFVPSPVTPTDLSVIGVTANQLEVASSTGTDAILSGATTTEAGLMTAADKISLGTWDRTGTVISPSNTGDDVNITGTVTATSFTGGLATTNLTGTITNAQLAGSISDDKLASTFLKNVSEDPIPQLGGHLDVNGNKINSASNGHIVLHPNGTGKTYIQNDNFNGNLQLGNGSSFHADIEYLYDSGNAKTLKLGSVGSGGNISLQCNGSERIGIDENGNISFSSGTDDTITVTSSGTGNIDINPGTGNVTLTATSALVLPVGTVAQRPGTAAKGMVRFNDDSDKFEGYDGNNWGSLVGGDIGTAPENIPINQYLGKQAFVDEVGTLRPYFPTGSFYSAPQDKGDIQFRYVSDTEVQLVMKGLDGTIRSSVVALETSVNTWTPTTFTIGSQSPTVVSATITRLGTTAILNISFAGGQTYASGDIVIVQGSPVNGDGAGVLNGGNSGAGGATVQATLRANSGTMRGVIQTAGGSINQGQIVVTLVGV